MSVCNDELAKNLEAKYLFLNRRWKDLSDLVKGFLQEENTKRKQEEFYSISTTIIETLDKIEKEIQDSLPCTIQHLKEQENRLYVSKRKKERKKERT